MNEQKWVQHISGQGEKWEVKHDEDKSWWVTTLGQRHIAYRLPKSEYVLCEPPEQWEDVTEACDVMFGCELDHRQTHVSVQNGYRLRKVGVEWFSGVPLSEVKKGWAFIVERKVTG